MKGVREPGPAVDFILNHSNLQKLYITSWDSDQDEWDRLLSGLSTFTSLHSLFLLWGGPRNQTFNFKITRHSLVAISKLKGLEHLAIGCAEGDNSAPTTEEYNPDADDNSLPQWQIDHDEVRAHLSSLKSLKKLAFIGDTYQPSDKHPDPQWYYLFNNIPSPEQDWEDISSAVTQDPWLRFIDKELGSERPPKNIWEHAHLLRMVQHSNAWSQELPRLEWFLCGQRPMEFIQNRDGLYGASPLGTARDECRTYLQQEFGLEPEDEEAWMEL